MAVLNGSVYSEALGMKTGVSFVVPYEMRDRKNTDIKVIYLLHGLSDDYMCWLYQSNVSRYANDRGVMIVMPEVQRSWYTDMKMGGKYFTYISKELPKMVENIFGITHTRDNTFIAGLSMGGYGALKCALKNPEFYKGVAAFSSVADIKSHRFDEAFYDLDFCFGEGVDLPDDENLMCLAQNLSEICSCKHPKIYMACGTEDFLLQDNRKFDQKLSHLNIAHTYEEWGGGHTWDFWNTAIQKAMNFFGM
ncbi:MAG: esterase family protein [Clostridia bacterium]|nr:esterase family protein [Clostridia bacterium]